MPELRKDPIVDRWVLIAPERADRPSPLLRAAPEEEAGPCPFCPGSESMTPPEILADRPAGSPRNGPGWTLRVVPNRFPALRTEETLERSATGLLDRMAGVGAHEVIIETDQHGRTLAQQTPDQAARLLKVVQDRILDLRRDTRLRCLVFFKNSGAPAGATLSHPHSQLIALPLVPAETRALLDASRDHFARKERCVFCDLLVQERRDGSRIVHENEGCVVLAPYAARSPFETWILPRRHRSGFEACEGNELRQVAGALVALLRKLDRALELPAYNVFLQTAPLREPPNDWFHWFLVVKPTLAQQAGFEWATGLSINPTPPEEAAAFLRQTEV